MTRPEKLARRLILAGTVTASAYAMAASARPTITAFRANPEPVLAGTTTTYAWTLTGATEATACTLDPGDGAPTLTIPDCAQSPATQHTYGAPGSYTATLHLQGAGASASASVTVVKHLPANPKPGSLLWTYQTPFVYPYQLYVYSSPAISRDGTIVFGSGGRHIYALNPDGTVKWRYRPSGGVFGSSPAISNNGTLYVGGDFDRALYAPKPNGTLR